jgi:hypothetical protein
MLHRAEPRLLRRATARGYRVGHRPDSCRRGLGGPARAPCPSRGRRAGRCAMPPGRYQNAPEATGAVGAADGWGRHRGGRQGSDRLSGTGARDDGARRALRAARGRQARHARLPGSRRCASRGVAARGLPIEHAIAALEEIGRQAATDDPRLVLDMFRHGFPLGCTKHYRM